MKVPGTKGEKWNRWIQIFSLDQFGFPCILVQFGSHILFCSKFVDLYLFEVCNAYYIYIFCDLQFYYWIIIVWNCKWNFSVRTDLGFYVFWFGSVRFGSHISNFGFQLFQFGSDMYWILFVYILLIHSSTLLFNYYWLMLLQNVKVPGTKGVKPMNSNFQFRPIQFLLYLDSIRFGLVLVYFQVQIQLFRSSLDQPIKWHPYWASSPQPAGTHLSYTACLLSFRCRPLDLVCLAPKACLHNYVIIYV